MSTEASGAGADKPAAPNEGEISKLVAEEIGKQLNGRLFKGGGLAKAVQEALAATLPQLIEQHLSKQPAEPTSPTTTDSNPAVGDKLSMKALEEKYRQSESKLREEFNAKFAAADKERQAAIDRAKDERLRGEVRAKLGSAIDPKYLDVAMDSLYDARKRFAYGEDGSAGVKFKRDGFEEVLSLDAGMKELMANELKPFVPAKNTGLPPAGSLRGYQPTAPQAADAGQKYDPFSSVIRNHFIQHGAPLSDDSGTNGTPQK